MIEAILFDLYETLAEPDWPRLRAGRLALAARVGLDGDLLMDQFRLTHQGRMRGHYGGLQGDLAEILKACGISPTDEVLGELADAEMDNWAQGVQLYDDVLPQLARFREAGYRLGIVSNASCEAASIVYRLALDEMVDAAVISCEVGLLKPEQEILSLALERLGVEPGRAILVDDVLDNLHAARQLGMHSALIERGVDRVDQSQGVYPTITALEELWPVLATSEPPEPPEAALPLFPPSPESSQRTG